MRSNFTGPVVITGNTNPQQVSDTEAGPNIDYQSNALLDSRFVSLAENGAGGAQTGIPCWHNPIQAETLSCVPQAKSNTIIAAAQTPTVGGFFTLASANTPGLAVNLPLIAQGGSVSPGTPTVNVLAIDFGFSLVTTVAGSATVTVTGPTPTPAGTGTAIYGTRFFGPGQRVIVAGAGNAAGTLPLFATVLATDRYAGPGQVVQAAGVLLLSTPALFSGTNQMIGTSDQEYGIVARAAVKVGAARVWSPIEMIARAVTVTASGASSGTVTVRGFDVYCQPMSQTITIAGTATATGTKAFKYISSVQLNTGATLTGTLAIGTADVFGFPLRCDEFEYTNIFVAGTLITVPTNIVFADQTVPATATTGDVRGTYALQTASNGSNKLVVFQTNPLAQVKISTNIDFRGIVGVTQS